MAAVVGIGDAVVGQGAGAVVVNHLAVIDVGPLDAAVAVLVLKGDVVIVDAAVDDGKDDAAAVIALEEPGCGGCLGQVEHLIDVGDLTGLVGGQLHDR